MTRRVIGLAAAVLLLAASAALAGGPRDAVYSVTETRGGAPPLVSFLVVLQNGTSIGLALLFEEGFWVYGFTQLADGGHVAGVLLLPDGVEYGSFDLVITDTSVTGSIVELGLSYGASGARLF